MRLIQLGIILGILILSSCRPDEDVTVITDGTDIEGNEIEVNSIEELGQLLFWDPILSGERDISCATCHHPDFGYADGRALPIGVGGRGLGPERIDVTADDIGLAGRNSPTIINTAFNGMNRNGDYNPALAPMFWDNRTLSLESQALGPLQSYEEMRGHAYTELATLDSLVNRLNANLTYRNMFIQIFGSGNPVTSDNIGSAIAAFERTIVARDSPFDRFQAGDQNAMTQNQIDGMNRFRQVGCIECHSGPMFSDFELHTLGVPDSPLREITDSGANGMYAFRTPTLRNLDETGPYFHNGVGGNLQQVLGFYRTISGPGGAGGPGPGPGGLSINTNVIPNDIDPDARSLRPFNNNDVQNIIAFIHALNDPNFDRSIPIAVPSGLNPGGDID